MNHRTYRDTARPGRVYLVGAGPGDPGLLTLRALELLKTCDVVLADALVPPEVLAYAGAQAELLRMGKRAGRHSCTQQDLHEVMIARARRGQVVVHLKGGDPFVFGRGGEEAEALTAADIDWEVVPGVSAGVAAAACAGIPLTHRDLASSVAFVSGHPAGGPVPGDLTAEADTLVVFMCRGTLVSVVRSLIDRGRARSTPVAIIRSGSCPDQRVYTSTLGDLALAPPALQTALEGEAPTLAVIGAVAALARRMGSNCPSPETIGTGAPDLQEVG